MEDRVEIDVYIEMCRVQKGSRTAAKLRNSVRLTPTKPAQPAAASHQLPTEWP